MKILLLGCKGQVGWELQRSLAPLGELVALDFDSIEPVADFARPEALTGTVRATDPDVIVNAAAYTAVDQAEAEPDLARTINTIAPGVLAQEAAARGAWLVHYSTDYVFDGGGMLPRNEDALTGPLNVYGHTKLDGERLVRLRHDRAVAMRAAEVLPAVHANAPVSSRTASEASRSGTHVSRLRVLGFMGPGSRFARLGRQRNMFMRLHSETSAARCQSSNRA